MSGATTIGPTIAITDNGRLRVAIIDTVLLKVASRCNLNCSYCYVYNMGDEGWRSLPKRMSADVQRATITQLVALSRAQQRPFSVVLHGGEPLLLGASRLADLFAALRAELPPRYGLHIQTNGLLLSNCILDLCAKFHVGISISLDGPRDINDQHRVRHDGRGSHSGIVDAVERVRSHRMAKELFSGLLAVVDPTSDPSEVYSFFKEIGAPSIDFLYRDGNHDRLPHGKASFASDEYGRWMSSLLDLYLSDPTPPRIRVLDDMLKLILGGHAKKEGMGISDYGIVIVDTDGSIRKNDTLKSVSNAIDHFDSNWSVLENQLDDMVNTPEFETYHAAQRPTASVCKKCPEFGVCGGGMPLHRWSDRNGFDNPSVFCLDQRVLIGRMREWIKSNRVAKVG
jgi:uncharacterized protein